MPDICKLLDMFESTVTNGHWDYHAITETT